MLLITRIAALSLLIALRCGLVSAAVTVAPGVDLIPGEFNPGTQPDGNTVIFKGRDGLVVFDTGRHHGHTQKIIDYSSREGLPVRVIVNSHWHLDHVGGNLLLRSAFPNVRVYASGAIDGALTGFLAQYKESLQKQLADKSTDTTTQAGYRDELAIIDAGARLGPDERIGSTGKRNLAGRIMVVGLAQTAVTAGDVWLFDPTTGVLASGDLITLPVPFLDTACPDGWQRALDALHRVDFKLLIPGHGEPMRREQFEVYRTAYGSLLHCARSTRTKSDCIDGWLQDAGLLVPATQQKFARSLMDYYMDTSLRADARHAAALCSARN